MLRDYFQLKETTNEYFDETVKRKRSDDNSRLEMDQGCILEEKIVQTTRLLFTLLNLNNRSQVLTHNGEADFFYYS